jgi:hypothetical protein
LADLLTKVVTHQKRWDFCYCLFCWVCLTPRLYQWHAMVLPPMPVRRDWRLYNMGQCMVKCSTMSSCMFMDIQTTCGDRMNYEMAMWWQADTRQRSGIFSMVATFW